MIWSAKFCCCCCRIRNCLPVPNVTHLPLLLKVCVCVCVCLKMLFELFSTAPFSLTGAIEPWGYWFGGGGGGDGKAFVLSEVAIKWEFATKIEESRKKEMQSCGTLCTIRWLVIKNRLMVASNGGLISLSTWPWILSWFLSLFLSCF